MHSVQKVVSCIMQAMDTPLADRAVGLLRDGEYKKLVDIKIHPRDYQNYRLYKRDAQVVATFRKLEGLPTGVDLHKAAVDSFFESERACKETNSRLARFNLWFERGFHGDAVDERMFLHIKRIRKIVADVLGPIPKDLTPRFSNGSTYNDKGDEITIPHKISSRPTVTSQAWTVVRDLFRGTAWDRASDIEPEIVFGNRFTSVNKDSTKNRGICVEPSLNVVYQLDVGRHLNRMLRNIGISISSNSGAVTAQTIHQHLARKASVDGLRATIDLSNASDTIAYMLVKLLLPKGWFDLLSALRSPYTLVNNKWIKNHKFSSMGCGFTFELETILFYAITKSVTPKDFVSTYGDDIICRASSSPAVQSLLKLFGFTVNTLKSFCDPFDPFRESCGGDYFNGEDVRPIFLKVIPATPVEWIVLANQVSLIKAKFRDDVIKTSYLDTAWRTCVKQVPKNYRLFGPTWAGDMVIHSEDRAHWKVRPARGEDGLDNHYFELKVVDPQYFRVKLKDFSPGTQLASALLAVPSSGAVPRDGISGFKTTWRATVM